jgi:hypothetical protein
MRSAWASVAALARFAFRHQVGRWPLFFLLVVLCLAARAPESATLPADDALSRASLRALARQDVWSTLFVFAPLFLLRAAELGRARAQAWFAGTPSGSLERALGLAFGCGLANLLTVALVALAAELSAGPAGEAWSLVREVSTPETLLTDQAPRARWNLPPLAEGERLRLRPSLALGAGPSTAVRLTLGSPDCPVSAERWLAGRTALELDVPTNAAPDAALALDLERTGPGALLYFPAGLQVLARAPSEHATAWILGGALALWWTALSCLSLGLARALRPALATTLVSVLFLASLGRSNWLPGSELPRLWEQLGDGLIPLPVSLAGVVGALLFAGVGVALACLRAEEAA